MLQRRPPNLWALYLLSTGITFQKIKRRLLGEKAIIILGNGTEHIFEYEPNFVG